MSTIFIGKAKLFLGNDNDDEFTPIANFAPATVWPEQGEITVSGTIDLDAEDRRNLLVWWIMLNALATANRILD